MLKFDRHPNLSLSLTSHLPSYASNKPTEAWNDIALTSRNYGTYGTINAKYMTHPADKTKAGYNTDKAGMTWNADYGLKDSLLDRVFRSHLYANRHRTESAPEIDCSSDDKLQQCYHENVLVKDGDSQKPAVNDKFACGSADATACFALVANYDDDDNKRYSYAKRGCANAIETIPAVGSSVFFQR